MGFVGGDKFTTFGDGVAIYPFEYFCAKDHRTGKITVTNNTYTIHHFAGTWIDRKTKFKKFIRRLIGERQFQKLKSILKINKL